MPIDPHRPPPRRILPFLVVCLTVVAVTLVGREAWQYYRAYTTSATDPDAAARAGDPRTPLAPDEAEAVRVFKSTRDSVVNVDTVALVRSLDLHVQQRQTGTGSGFIWDDGGRIVTNFHVVKESVTQGLGLRVVLADRSEWDARVVGVAPESDLAVVQITAPGKALPKIKVGRSDDLEVGQTVYAIGNPFGLSLTMTKGIISALGREIESLSDQAIGGAIQTDAPINPGNSGGPLLDKDGRLIGVTTSIATPSGGNVGIGFAIPVDTVNAVVPNLIRHGRVLKPDLGVQLVDDRRLRRAGFKKGVMIQQADPLGPAAKAGLRGLRADTSTGSVEPGDLILAVGDTPVSTVQGFNAAVAAHKVGEKVKLQVEREGEPRTVEVVVGGV